MFCNFTTTTYGKWILAGEHTVIRHQPALVFPLHSKQFSIRYQADPQPVRLSITGLALEQIHTPFWQTMARGCQFTQQTLAQLTGTFTLHNTIPTGAGLGASAALCVGLSRWFAAQALIKSTHVIEFARELENLFHGKSSGLDIIGSAANQHGLLFCHGQQPTPITMNWQPQWYLSFCGANGDTAQCVHQIEHLWQQDPTHAAAIDEQMVTSVHMACQALAQPDAAQGLPQLIQAIEIAHQCFAQWGLLTTPLRQHIQLLHQHGAHAAKPTGSGGGGYVLSVWNQPPPPMQDVTFIAV